MVKRRKRPQQDSSPTEAAATDRSEGLRLSWKTFVIGALLSVAGLAAYWPVSANGFVYFDDPSFITENHYVKNGLSSDSIRWAMTELYTDCWHPLTWLSLMLDAHLFGLWAGGFHLVNLGFHIASTLLLFGFLRYTTKRLWASAFVAGLFALHPLHVESVAWAAERKDVLSTFFWVCTVCAYSYYAARPAAWRYLAVLALYALGLLSKPMLVTLPVVLLLIDYWPLERFSLNGWHIKARQGTTAGRLIIEKIPLLVMALSVAVLTLMGQQKTAIADLSSIGLAARLVNAVNSCGTYIWQMFWPAGLAMFYPYPGKPAYTEALVWMLVFTAAFLTAARLAGRARYTLMGLLWYFVTLLPVIGLLQVGEQAHADRYTYMPLTGIFIILVWGASDAVRRYPRVRMPVAAMGVIILALCGSLTWCTARYWHDSIRLFEKTIASTGSNPKMEVLLAGELIKKGDVERATAILKAAGDRYPQDGMVFCGLGAVATAQGRAEDALKLFKKAAHVQPQLQEAYYSIGLTLTNLDRYGEAEGYLRKAAGMKFHNAKPYAYLGLTLMNLGRNEEAMDACRTATEFDPDIWVAHFVAARILLGKGDMAGAAAELAECNRLELRAATLADYGSCMMSAGKPQEAEKALRKAIEMQPGYASAHFNLGVTLAELGRRTEAAEEVRRAASLDPNNQRAKDLLKLLTEGQQ
jgi:protein O-mannosyl-transferase